VIRQADVADPEEARALVRDTIARFGALDGVIHAAGVTGGGALQRWTREDSLAILRPKVHGTLALDAALRDVPINFFFLCSSLTAILGGFGQADYAAANTFQDAFAQATNVEGKRLVVSVAWDGWREVGAAARHAQRTAPGVAAGAHPLLASSAVAEARATFETELDPSPWLLSDHKLGGRNMLPGTAYTELAFAAALAMGLRLPLRAREISLLSPLFAGAARSLRTEATRVGFDLAIRFSTGEGAEERVHSLAKISPEAPARLPPLDLKRLTASGAERATSLPFRVRTGGVEVGPRWSCLVWWQETAEGTLGRFELPETFQREASEFWLHPALFDATSSVVRDEGERLLVPFAYTDLTLYERLPAAVHCLATWEARPNGLEAKLTLAADDGRIVATIGGYVLRALHPRSKGEV
jgi:phthiocerol/phenolphthiocerol synthesis type-I polyketide synthase E